jgi:hypothetical protein
MKFTKIITIVLSATLVIGLSACSSDGVSQEDYNNLLRELNELKSSLTQDESFGESISADSDNYITNNEIPMFVGMSYEETVAQYPNIIFKPSEVFSSEYPKGVIIQQNVTSVDVIVSMGAELIELNNYEGGLFRIEDVTSRIERQGLSYIIMYEHSETIAADYVIRTDPPAEAFIEKDTIITVYVSSNENLSEIRTFTINHEVAPNRTGDFILEFYIDDIIQSNLTKTQNIELEKEISWTVEGAKTHICSLYITSVETGKRALFYEYEIDFTKDPPISTQIEMNSRIFSEISEG